MTENISFKKHLEKYLNKSDLDELLLSLNDDEVKGLYLNNKLIDDETFIKKFPNVKKHPFVPHAFIYEKNMYDFGRHYLYELGAYYIQEPSSSIPPSILKFDDGDLILDMCAAPGGKSIALSLKNPQGVVIANDISRTRLEILVNNIERMGIDNIVVTCKDYTRDDIVRREKETYDAILLDAPCSGSGMFRKMEEMKDDWTYEKVLKCQAIQKQLIINAFSMLKEGGCLVYSTCSYSYEEDEEIISFLLNNTSAELIPIENNSLFYKSKDIPQSIHLFPSKFPGEGQFIALIRKKGLKSSTAYRKSEKNDKLYKQFNIDTRDNIMTKDAVYSLTHRIEIKNGNIVRYGVKALEKKGKEFIPTHHYARAIAAIEKYKLNDSEFKHYISGAEIDVKNNLNGWVALTYQNFNVGLGKAHDGKMKNHYPKGLRIANINL